MSTVHDCAFFGKSDLTIKKATTIFSMKYKFHTCSQQQSHLNLNKRYITGLLDDSKSRKILFRNKRFPIFIRQKPTFGFIIDIGLFPLLIGLKQG